MIPAIVVFAAVVCGTAVLWSRQTATTAALITLQRQCEDLRSQLEARDQTLAELRSSIERWQHSAPATSITERAIPSAPGVSADFVLTGRLADLTLLQSNTLALVERLMARAAAAQPPPESPRQQEAAIAALEFSAAEHQQKLDAAKQRAAELLAALNIPAEVSTMDPSKALDTASLRAYWPFFEAKWERDSVQFLMDRLRLRLAQEQLDARVEAQKATAR
jgi:DNA repair exonuclease SbcCD ATPase subunit